MYIKLDHYSSWISRDVINTIKINLGRPLIDDYFCNRLGSLFEFEQTIRFTEEYSKPSFDLFAKVWSSYCKKNNKLYFKTPKHLEYYFNLLQDPKKYGDFVLLNIGLVREVRNWMQSATVLLIVARAPKDNSCIDRIEIQ